ncbi:hypothetical protein NL529_30225, partial [Klebsiella pneumoniae]|nr:hypothetical protein [Klebsiella pneumoniae]
TASGDRLNIEGIGSIRLAVTTSTGATKRFRIDEILYVPQLRRNLLCVDDLEANGARVYFFNREIHTKDNLIIPLSKKGKLQYLQGQ